MRTSWKVAAGAAVIVVAAALASWVARPPLAPLPQVPLALTGGFAPVSSFARACDDQAGGFRGTFLRGELSFGGRPCDGAGGGEEEVTDQLEPFTGAQLTTMLGYGDEAVWKHLWLANETGSPLQPALGPGQMTTTAGTPTYNVAGPLDSIDKAVRYTDGQAAQIGTGNGAVQIQGNHWAILFEAKVAVGTPGGARNFGGHESTEDVFVQLQTNGQPRIVVVDSVAGTLLAPLTVAHNDGLWHTYLAIGINGANMRLATDLGLGTATSIAAVAAINTAASWTIGRSGANPPADISIMAVAISDGSTAQNNALIDLYNNAAAAVANYRAATGR
jgi:hypothetical protein